MTLTLDFRESVFDQEHETLVTYINVIRNTVEPFYNGHPGHYGELRV